MILQRLVFTPFATWAMKLKFGTEIRVLNKDIDSLLKKRSKQNIPIADQQIQKICEKHGKTWNEVRRAILNRRRNKANDLKLVKFSEALWRFLFYLSFNIIGYFALFHPQTAFWIKDSTQNYVNWPHHPVPDLLRLYYLIELGSYFHQLMWTEVTRSDAAEMIIHHLATILLISTSYLNNFLRLGSLIMLCHDAADVFLEGAKLFNYASKVKEFKPVCSVVCDTLFATFAVVFLITRLILFPRYLIHTWLFESPTYLGTTFNYYFLGTLLVVLQCLHVFWFYLISRMIVKLFSGGIKKDERSDDEEEDLHIRRENSTDNGDDDASQMTASSVGSENGNTGSSPRNRRGAGGGGGKRVRSDSSNSHSG